MLFFVRAKAGTSSETIALLEALNSKQQASSERTSTANNTTHTQAQQYNVKLLYGQFFPLGHNKLLPACVLFVIVAATVAASSVKPVAAAAAGQALESTCMGPSGA